MSAARGGDERSPLRSSWAFFQYIGGKGISVRAPVSGRVYRFETTGTVLAVEARDRRALAGVPDLIQVARP